MELVSQKDTSKESEDLFDRRLKNIVGKGIEEIRRLTPDEGDKVIDAAELHTCPPYQLVLRGDALWSLYYLIPEDVPEGCEKESMCRELLLKEDESAPDSSVAFEVGLRETIGLGTPEFIARAVPLHDSSDSFMEFALNRYVLSHYAEAPEWRLERFLPAEVLSERPSGSVNIFDRPKRLLLDSRESSHLFDQRFENITGVRMSEFAADLLPIRLSTNVDSGMCYVRGHFMFIRYQDGSCQLHEFTDMAAVKKEYAHTYTFSFQVTSKREDRSDLTDQRIVDALASSVVSRDVEDAIKDCDWVAVEEVRDE